MLLDEPLANLDYKLREELREELPRIFARTGADLGLRDDRADRSAAARRRHRHLGEGRVTQFGPTADVYRRPANIDAARVFSDPPLNELPIEQARAARHAARAAGNLPAVGVLLAACPTAPIGWAFAPTP